MEALRPLAVLIGFGGLNIGFRAAMMDEDL
jgi:hypothetical protein